MSDPAPKFYPVVLLSSTISGTNYLSVWVSFKSVLVTRNSVQVVYFRHHSKNHKWGIWAHKTRQVESQVKGAFWSLFGGVDSNENVVVIQSLSLSLFPLFPPPICHEVMGPDATILVFWILSFKPTFSLSSSTFIKRLFSCLLSAIMVMSSAYLRLLIFLPAILIPAVLPPAQRFSWCTLHIS